MNQKELQAKAQAQRDRVNTDEDGGILFEDVSKCDVCASRNIKYIERQNGVLTECLDCSEYFESQDKLKERFLENE